MNKQFTFIGYVLDYIMNKPKTKFKLEIKEDKYIAKTLM